MHRLLFSFPLILVFLVLILPAASPARAQTFISGTVITADGMVVASGVVALERGELHNNEFETGGAIGPDGTFKIHCLPEDPGASTFTVRAIFTSRCK